MDPRPYKMLITTIKQTLKSRGLTYADLAKLLGMSESGLKKMFTGKDSSFGRILQVCEALGLTLRDVLDMDSSWKSQVIEFTEDQETYLLEDEEALKVFFLTAYDGFSIAETRTQMNLSNTRMNQILRKLDKLNLIQWLPYDQTHVRRDGIVLWKNKGKLVEFIKQNWSKELLAEVLENELPENSGDFVLSYLKLTDASVQDFRHALLRLLDEFRLRSRHEINYHGLRKLRGFRVVVANKEGSFAQ